MPVVPFTAEDATRLEDTFEEVVAAGATPGGVLAHGTLGSAPHFLSVGRIASECGDLEPDKDTRYDVASLTKVVATWPLVGQALQEGLLDLDAPIRDALPPMSGETPSAEPTVRQLLAHTSGLRASTRLDHYRGAELPLHELLSREPLEGDAGRHRYINRGYILLGLALAHLYHQSLDQLTDSLWRALGMNATVYGPVARTRQVAPTERRIPGAPRVWGTAHDDNAVLLGGIAGHAGVFSTPADLATYAQRLLSAHVRGDEAVLGRWLHASLVPQIPIEPGLDRGLSWILATGGRVAYHHGFTGTSLFLAPETGRYLVICTNAIYDGNARTRIAPLRSLALKTISAT
ncbi:serine hydrolase domain-containing protein [Streptomyces sp. NPDC005576]|uniref:serine hydrolase domain-containing protein n=1 Tax=Streptomyces sp. NPDC005576 TaxID=3364726 RepID=UPI0036B38C59